MTNITINLHKVLPHPHSEGWLAVSVFIFNVNDKESLLNSLQPSPGMTLFYVDQWSRHAKRKQDLCVFIKESGISDGMQMQMQDHKVFSTKSPWGHDEFGNRN